MTLRPTAVNGVAGERDRFDSFNSHVGLNLTEIPRCIVAKEADSVIDQLHSLPEFTEKSFRIESFSEFSLSAREFRRTSSPDALWQSELFGSMPPET